MKTKLMLGVVSGLLLGRRLRQAGLLDQDSGEADSLMLCIPHPRLSSDSFQNELADLPVFLVAQVHRAYHSLMDFQFTAVFRQVPEGYIGFVEELPGANTQGATLEEARANLQEAVAMVMEANREPNSKRRARD